MTIFKKKGKKGPKCNVALTAALAFVAASSFAASNNMTVSSTINPYISSAPVFGTISATITSTTAPVAMALPIAPTSKHILGFNCTARDTSHNAVPRNYQVSGSDIVVASATGQASGTVAVGDRVTCIVNYQR